MATHSPDDPGSNSIQPHSKESVHAQEPSVRRDLIVYAVCLSTCLIGICIYFLSQGSPHLFERLWNVDRLEQQMRATQAAQEQAEEG